MIDAIVIACLLVLLSALGIRMRYEYLWLQNIGVYIHEYMDVDDE